MPASPTTLLVREATRVVETALVSAGRDDARSLSEWLVAEAAGIGRLEVLLHGNRTLDEQARARLDAWVARVASGEPLQYVLGSAPFMGRNFRCDPRALIPRPETEELCERALASIPPNAVLHIADVGTGTGCIAITLALERPMARVMAIELSAETLSLARENARQFGVDSRVEWRQADLLAGIPKGTLDLVVSNPPYIAEDEWARVDRTVRDYEPRLALAAGGDGLAVIRRLVAQARHALAPGGRLWMEIGNEQGPAVRDLLAASGFVEAAIRRDFAGRERIAEARKPDV